jgi:hypothetical protein
VREARALVDSGDADGNDRWDEAPAEEKTPWTLSHFAAGARSQVVRDVGGEGEGTIFILINASAGI